MKISDDWKEALCFKVPDWLSKKGVQNISKAVNTVHCTDKNQLKRDIYSLDGIKVSERFLQLYIYR